jgi:hypothetical protein
MVVEAIPLAKDLGHYDRARLPDTIRTMETLI